MSAEDSGNSQSDWKSIANRKYYIVWTDSKLGSGAGDISDWSEIETRIELIENQVGQLILRGNFKKNIQCGLEIQYKGGWIAFLFDPPPDGNFDDIRKYWGGAKGQGDVSIFGELWYSSELTRDLSVVKKIYRQFYETGTVSIEFLR